jgi:catechol 2,3-dioxygenase-like lactoylglutathione lyase family enzyme
MAFHHVAMAVRDIEASHRFYTEAMGFELVKVDVVPIRKTGWARHLFYETGDGGMLALWDIHDEKVSGFDPAISTGLGLPVFVNHIAFVAADLEDLDARTDRWLANGHDVVRVDHGWCESIYATDPNGTLVEYCVTTRALDAADRLAAEELLAAAEPPFVDRTPPPTRVFAAAEREAARAPG